MKISPSHADVAGEAALVATGDALATTTITAHLDEPHCTGRSLLFCSTFQLAWNELRARAGGPVRLDGALPFADPLNACLVSKDDLDEASYVARAGLGAEGILAAIRAELAAKFGDAASPSLLPPRVGARDLFAYAYLFKNLGFAVPFELGDADEDELRSEFATHPGELFGTYACVVVSARKV